LGVSYSLSFGRVDLVVKSSPIDCLSNSAKRLKPNLATIPIIKELAENLSHQFVGAAESSTSYFLLQLRFKILRDCDFHGIYLGR
jgi:hypothetical protein